MRGILAAGMPQQVAHQMSRIIHEASPPRCGELEYGASIAQSLRRKRKEGRSLKMRRNPPNMVK
jgi:hypothetical protein